MKHINEYPNFSSDDSWDWGDYTDLIATLEYDTILWADAGSYQGDSYVILKDEEQYGYLEFGWGSCSGCDALLACRTHGDLEELRDSLSSQIKWFDSLEELQNYFRTHDWQGDWVYHEEEHRKFRESVLQIKV